MKAERRARVRLNRVFGLDLRDYTCNRCWLLLLSHAGLSDVSPSLFLSSPSLLLRLHSGSAAVPAADALGLFSLSRVLL